MVYREKELNYIKSKILNEKFVRIGKSTVRAYYILKNGYRFELEFRFLNENDYDIDVAKDHLRAQAYDRVWKMFGFILRQNQHFYCGEGAYPGITTKDGGEIFCDYENNYAISPFCFAGGHDNLSGARAFTVVEVDGANNVYVLDDTEGLEIGDVYSVHFYNQRENHGKIVAIDKTTNRVTVDVIFDEGLNTRDVPVEKDGFDNEKNTFRIIAKPFVGTRKIGCATANFGYENRALSKGAFNSGLGNLAQGSYSFNSGMYNRAGYCAASFGRYVDSLGFMTFGAGWGIKLFHETQIGFGRFNVIDADGKWLFVIGNGQNEGTRSNAMSVDFEGNATFKGNLYTKDGEEEVLTNKNAVKKAMDILKDDSMGDLKNLAKDTLVGNIVGAFAVNPLIDGVTGAFSVTLDFPIIYDTYEVLVNDKSLDGDVNKGESLVSAPLVFKGDNIKVLFKKEGKILLTAKTSCVKETGNIIYGRMEI